MSVADSVNAMAMVVADTAAQVAVLAMDTVNWQKECYLMLVDIRGVVNWIFLLLLGVLTYIVIGKLQKLSDKFFDKRKRIK
jgi:hypothetical protein